MPSFFKESLSLVMLFFMCTHFLVSLVHISPQFKQAIYQIHSLSLSIPYSFIQLQTFLKVTLAADSVASASQSPQVQS